MARPMKPLVRSGGYYPSNRWIPLVYPGGYTTANGGGQPEPEAVLKTVTGSLIHITDALALPAEALSVNVEPIQDLHGYDNPWPAGGGVNLLPPYSLPSVTNRGVTLTNNNGEYTLNGTVDSGVAVFDVRVSLPAGQYAIAFNNPTANSNVKIYGIDEHNAMPMQVLCSTANATATVTFESTVKIFRIRVLRDGPVDNFKLSPVFSAGATAATKFYPYSNICPISGWVGANIHVSPTTDAADGTTYSITFPSSAGTVYGGTLDVTRGVLTVDRALWTKNTATMDNAESYPGWKKSGVKALIGDGLAGAITAILNIGNQFSVNTRGNNDVLFLATGIYGKTQTEWQALAIDVQIIVPLSTPIEITLTPTQIDMLLGENNLWSDAGDSTLTYYAEGEASTSEALGILLGGTYNNPGSADDVSDDEALGILLGGS